MPTYPVRPEAHGSYQWLLREVGGYLGMGYDRGTWRPEQRGKVDSIVQSGVMQFYYPPPVEGVAHQWSFLTPLTEITLSSGVKAYDLPQNFSGILGEFTHQTGTTTNRIAIVPEPRLRQLYATDARDDTPEYAAIRPKDTDGTESQRYEVIFYPTPDSAITLEYRHSVSPDPLTEDKPWPLCGRQHAERLLQSCLAVAEERETKQQGAATARFMEQLAAAIQLDQQSARATDQDIWPLGNPPDDLTVDYDYLKRLVGRHMKFGPHEGSWTHNQQSQVEEAIRSGLRRFYTPAVLPGERHAHEWSFLRPIKTLVTQANIWEYDLPADFAFIDGPLTYAPDESVLYRPINQVSEHQLRSRRQTLEYTFRPEIAAIRVKPQIDGVGTRWEILFWPTPDDAYSINYRYRTNPGLLSSGVAEPAGGMPHAQTVIESCLMSADELLGTDDKTRYARYIECLKTSVSHDRIAHSPESLGYNRDMSDAYLLDGYTDGSLFYNWHYDSIHSVNYE